MKSEIGQNLVLSDAIWPNNSMLQPSLCRAMRASHYRPCQRPTRFDLG